MSTKLIVTCDKKDCECKEGVKGTVLQNGWTTHYYEGNYYDDSYTETLPYKAHIDLCLKHTKEFNSIFSKKLFDLVGEREYISN